MADEVSAGQGATGDTGAAAESQTQSGADRTQESTQQDAGNNAFLAKLQGVDTSETGGEAGGEVGTPEGESATGGTDKPKLDPELAKYAEAKGYSLQDVEGSTAVQASIKAQREMEANMNRMMNEFNQLKTQSLNTAAQTVLEPEPTGADGKPQEELSPIQSFDNDAQVALRNLLFLHGCQSVQEFEQNYPQAAAAFQRQYREEKDKLISEEIKWHSTKKDRDAEKIRQEQTLKNEAERVKVLYKENLSEAKASDPEIETNLVKSGAVQLVGALAQLMGVPNDYLLASKPVFQWVARASKAISEMENFDKPNGRLAKAKAEWEKSLAKASEAALASPDSPLPEDEQAKSSILRRLSAGREVSIIHN